MNSLFNSALKQSQSIQKDLSAFAGSNGAATSSPALQGQISASLASLQRTIDDYDALARRELIPQKQEKARTRIENFRKDLSEFREQFSAIKAARSEAEAEAEHSRARTELLGRRAGSSGSDAAAAALRTATPENPYANASVQSRAAGGSVWGVTERAQMPGSAQFEDHVFRERDFHERAHGQLDEFLERGRQVLTDLGDQRDMLKNTQRKLYTVANTLGISRDTIRMIERRASQDKWIFYSGVIVFFVFCYFVIKWLR